MNSIRGPTVILIAVLLATVPVTKAEAEPIPIVDNHAMIQNMNGEAATNVVAGLTGYVLSMPNTLGFELVAISASGPPLVTNARGYATVPDPPANKATQEKYSVAKTKSRTSSNTIYDVDLNLKKPLMQAGNKFRRR